MITSSPFWSRYSVIVSENLSLPERFPRGLPTGLVSVHLPSMSGPMSGLYSPERLKSIEEAEKVLDYFLVQTRRVAPCSEA